MLSLWTTAANEREVDPVILQSPNVPGEVSAGSTNISAASVQILDAGKGFGTVLATVPQPSVSAPALGPQILAGGQTMRFSVVAGDPTLAWGIVALNSYCQASVAVFDNLTGRTWTYQSTQAALPAVQ